MATTSPAMQKLLLLKSRIPFFKGLTNQNIIEVIENVRIITYNKGDVLFVEGSKSDKDIFFLLKGSVDVTKATPSGEIKLTTLSDPGIFGEMRAITNEPRSTSIIAGEEGVLVISFNIKEKQDLGKALFYKNIIEELSKKLIAMNEFKSKQ